MMLGCTAGMYLYNLNITGDLTEEDKLFFLEECEKVIAGGIETRKFDSIILGKETNNG